MKENSLWKGSKAKEQGVLERQAEARDGQNTGRGAEARLRRGLAAFTLGSVQDP